MTTINDLAVNEKTSTCDAKGGRWLLFGSMTIADGFTAADVIEGGGTSGVYNGNSVQVGTFNKGSPGKDMYSLDVQRLASANQGNEFDLMIEYGSASNYYSHCISGFQMVDGKFINNKKVNDGVIIGENGMWGTDRVDGYYATFCAYGGGCGIGGEDFWGFSTNGVYPNSDSSVPCGFYFPDKWKDCVEGDNEHRMRYYIRLQEETIDS